jgi:oxygen-dependent protoporphyrinogen oxidase
MASVCIIGGGITGLAGAFRLQRLAPEVDLTILEVEQRLGGKIVTEHTDGFVIEGGPDSFLTSKPRGIGLSEELGISARFQNTRGETRRAYVLHAGTLYPMPEGLTALVPSRLEPLLTSELFTSEGKARLRQEPDVPPLPADGDESLASFVERRFGREVYDRLIEPLMAGIYAGDGEVLSLGATFPHLRAMELTHGSLIAGIQASPRSDPHGRVVGFATPSGGLSEIVDALRGTLHRARIRVGTAAVHLEQTQRGFRVSIGDGSDQMADAVIIATPAHVAATLLSRVSPGAASALGMVPHVSTATVTVSYPTDALPELPIGHGYVIPRAERRAALACSFVSQKFGSRSPEGQVLLRVFVGRAGEQDPTRLSDLELLELARAELQATLGIRAEPTVSRIFRWPHAMPQYTLGHLDRLRLVDTGLSEVPGIYLAGALRGIGIPDCIASGEAAANTAAGYVQALGPVAG